MNISILLKAFVAECEKAIRNHWHDKGEDIPPVGQLTYYRTKIREHLAKDTAKDYIDIANYAMFAWNEKEGST